MGAPQHHGQRSYKNSIATYSEQAANDLNIDTNYFPEVFDLGYDYNEHVGEIDRYRINEYGDTIHSSYTRLNTKKNYFVTINPSKLPKNIIDQIKIIIKFILRNLRKLLPIKRNGLYLIHLQTQQALATQKMS